MKKRSYFILILLSTILSQIILHDRRTENYYPLVTWTLLTKVPKKKVEWFLYLVDIKSGEECYFYLCPRIDHDSVKAYHYFNLARRARDLREEQELLEKARVELKVESIGYKPIIKKENTTMTEKWKEISKKLIKI